MNQDFKKIIYSMHPLMRKVLHFIHLKNIDKIAKEANIEESVATTAIQLLEQNEFAIYEKKESQSIALDKFGEKFVDVDLPEVQLLNSIKDKSKVQKDLGIDGDVFAAAIGVVKRSKLVNINKNDKGLNFEITKDGLNFLKKNINNPLKEFKIPVLINDLTKTQKNIFDDFKARKGFLKEIITKIFFAKLTKKGEEIVKEIENNFKNLELLETLDTQMLKSNSWKGKEFRHYNVNVATSIPKIGRRHPMMEANNILRDIFLQMGFNEMQGPMIESAFWNMDTMWIPQDHPARDEQDTFYLDGESQVPENLVEKVKDMHETGIKRSHTLNGEWSKKITKKRLLRTHSTSTTFRKLASLGEKQQKGENIDGKYFYLANVFRNEAVDATHLAEFFQGEGFIIGDDLSLANLMGFVKEYLGKLGFDKVKFKPTFNPYTEPSMEAHIYDEEIGKWYALINSGIFRPETLEPMGIKDKTIIAWGFGASRIAAKLASKTSMRDITGGTCDLEWLKSRKITKRYVKGGAE